ncbi:MCP four helix bundle domain-containing protein [Pedobacter caeni]|uniref:Four helix bundle sensory module for signal transduction n=1 Tax=Pedobacter caeni TaxID=288992 RepID=A0A1M5H069_9SPHI|nr:MCP four helix bundle domain-containing protein [Pedobacter caeni]SHG09383.1 Four helix bundle sensory module for signal transduction [Pedobacter caeni]
MKFAYSIKQKMKIATLLFAIMACMILIRILEDKSVKSMNESFVSMYNDRLVPATDLFYIAENIFEKKYTLDSFLYSGKLSHSNAAGLKEQVNGLNSTIDSLLKKYEKTFLVTKEKEQLSELKNRLAGLIAAEQHVIALSLSHTLEDGRKLYETIGRENSMKALEKLTDMMSIQTQVGQELIQSSASMVSRSKLYSTLQIALAVLIGILIVGIISASNVVQVRNDKFNLN